MKVFLSWSGETSHDVACALRDWLPCVIQALKPYVSSEDIEKGTRWSSDIARELEDSTFGIICITAQNVSAPWINFEAGALSRALDGRHVTPFLFGIKPADVTGPLLQFQFTLYEQADVQRLLQTLNQSLEPNDRLTDAQLQKAFNVWWADLRTRLDAIAVRPNTPAPRKESKSDLVLEELLELARAQQRLLKAPDEILPAEYLHQVFPTAKGAVNLSSQVTRFREFSEYLVELLKRIKERGGPEMTDLVVQAQRAVLTMRLDVDEIMFATSGTRLLPSEQGRR